MKWFHARVVLAMEEIEYTIEICNEMSCLVGTGHEFWLKGEQSYGSEESYVLVSGVCQ